MSNSSYSNNATLSAAERAEIRRVLIAQGQPTRGKTDGELIALAGGAAPAADPAPAPKAGPAPAPKAEPAPAPKAGPAPAPKAEPAPAPKAAPGDLASAISAAIAAAVAAQPAALDEARVLDLIRQHAASAEPTRVDITLTRADLASEPVTIDGAHPALVELMETLELATVAAQWPYLCGPAGSGKTTLAMQAAKLLDLPFYSTGAVSDSFLLVGFMSPVGDYISTPLYDAYTKGGVFLFDEIDGSSADALVAFNQMLANGVYTFPDGKTYHRHPDCYLIAAANTIGHGATRQYIARQQLDGATMDRFHLIDVGYCETLEYRLACDAAAAVAPGASLSLHNSINLMIAAVRKIRADFAASGSDAIVSPRASIAAAAQLAKGHSIETAIERVIMRKLSTDQQQRARAAMKSRASA